MKFRNSYWFNWFAWLTKTNWIKEFLRGILKLDYFDSNLVRIINDLPTWSCVADCWCWQWINTQRIQQLRPDLIVDWIDIWEFIPKNLDNFLNLDLNKLIENPSLKEKYDLVINMHVIEHVQDPLLLVENLIYILKKSWILYIECPSVKNIFAYWHINFYTDPTHIRPYNKSTFERIIKYFNWEKISVWYNTSSYICRLLSIFLIPLLLFFNRELSKYLFIKLIGFNCYLLMKK